MYNLAQNGTLRLQRPDFDAELQRRHDIDSEVELLDWMDSTNISNNHDDFISAICKRIQEKQIDFEIGCEGVYNLIELCSVGYWEAWEAVILFVF